MCGPQSIMSRWDEACASYIFAMRTGHWPSIYLFMITAVLRHQGFRLAPLHATTSSDCRIGVDRCACLQCALITSACGRCPNLDPMEMYPACWTSHCESSGAVIIRLKAHTVDCRLDAVAQGCRGSRCKVINCEGIMMQGMPGAARCGPVDALDWKVRLLL